MYKTVLPNVRIYIVLILDERRDLLHSRPSFQVNSLDLNQNGFYLYIGKFSMKPTYSNKKVHHIQSLLDNIFT